MSLMQKGEKVAAHRVANSFMAWPLVMLFVLTQPVYGLEFKDFFKRPDQRAVELLDQGLHEEAASLFENNQWRGVSQYRAGKYQEAMQEFSGAEEAGALYNHGTAAARAGDYESAVKSLETALNLEPDNKQIEHNLDIAKKLKELAEQNQNKEQQQDGDSEQDKQEGEEGEEQEGSESEEQKDSEESQQSDGGSDASEQSSDGQSDQSGEGQEPQSGGELSEDTESPESQQPLELDDFKDAAEEPSKDPLEGQQDGQQDGQQGEGKEIEQVAAAESTVSEDDQATQQWLRRIPDDASQLLRNKIRLNHMIEYPEVNHMQEPW